jgi:hypothetical protein
MEIEKFNQAYSRYQEKQKSKDKVNLVLDDLYKIITVTRQNIFLWNQLYEGIRKRPEIIDLFSLFVITSANLLTERIILDISKLFDKGKSSINTDFLHNLIINEGKKHFTQEVYQKMQNQVVEDKNEIEKYNSLILKIKSKRDKEIAHLDKGTLGNEFDEETKIELEELGNILKSIEGIYSNYYSICNYQKLSSFGEYLHWLEGFGVTTTFDDLFSLIDFALDTIPEENQNDTIKKVIFGRQIRKLAEEHESSK